MLCKTCWTRSSWRRSSPALASHQYSLPSDPRMTRRFGSAFDASVSSIGSIEATCTCASSLRGSPPAIACPGTTSPRWSLETPSKAASFGARWSSRISPDFPPPCARKASSNDLCCPLYLSKSFCGTGLPFCSTLSLLSLSRNARISFCFRSASPNLTRYCPVSASSVSPLAGKSRRKCARTCGSAVPALRSAKRSPSCFSGCWSRRTPSQKSSSAFSCPRQLRRNCFIRPSCPSRSLATTLAAKNTACGCSIATRASSSVTASAPARSRARWESSCGSHRNATPDGTWGTAALKAGTVAGDSASSCRQRGRCSAAMPAPPSPCIPASISVM
mmetsp:Transcript_56010/g.131284  ORF Transcript_56010/g.131284 Transcript_56010/m.131284 type:complete len:332 (-) Transcript_56010:158-1153(-)